jgi:hypothetical protein
MRTTAAIALALSLGALAACSSTAPSTVDAATDRDGAAVSDAAVTTDAAAPAHDAASTTDGAPCGVTDLSAIRTNCTSTMECGPGYVCQDFEGAILTQSCQIPCDPAGCPCPSGTSCNMHDDKRNMPWHQCDLDA